MPCHLPLILGAFLYGFSFERAGLLCQDLTKGALRGARGNSGVILSQILKGFANVVSPQEELDIKNFARALKSGVELAYSAVAKPKEGTMLTVIRVMTEHALEISKKPLTYDNFLSALIEKGEEILAQTPEMLDVLKKAGVVDSGGYGIIMIFKGMLKGYRNEEIEGAEDYVPTPVSLNLASGSNKLVEDIQIDYENLDVKDLSFSYDGQTEVLKDIKMHAEKGEIIGIVGESGCGKSTFLKLLMRFWERSGGEIDYDDIDIDKINTNSLLKNVTMVSQTTYLFEETIEDNLRIAKPDATPEEIENACKMAAVHDFIMTLPDGYKTQVTALGDNLSAGEKQRIGLARAFLRGSELILLDEPTSNVDSINEGIILKALKEQKNKKSIILVSHRESTMAIADRIYKVDCGVMTEEA